MEKTKQAIIQATKVVNLTLIVVILTTVTILQNKIGDLAPEGSNATVMQSWMTFLAVVFCFLGVTEVFEESELMLLKPRIYKKVLDRRDSLRKQPDQEDEPMEPLDNEESTKDQSCLYELIFCGLLRRCLFSRDRAQTQRSQKRTRCVGLSICTTLTLISTAFMELSHRKIWSQWFPETFAPHYSEELSAADSSQLDTVNLTKTSLFSFLVVFGLIFQCTFYILLPFVSLIGSPFFAYWYCRWTHEGQSQQQTHVESKRIEDSASKALRADSGRLNQVVNHSQENDSEAYPNRESIAPIIGEDIGNGQEQNVDQSARNGRENQGREMDVVEMLRMESIDIRINPVGMRRIIFRVQKSFKSARKEQKALAKMAAIESGEKEIPLSDECSVCLVNFTSHDQVAPLSCNIDHLFHVECLLSWADHNYTCPICRQPIIKSKSEIELYETMQQRNQMNLHEDQLASGVVMNANNDDAPDFAVEPPVAENDAPQQIAQEV